MNPDREKSFIWEENTLNDNIRLWNMASISLFDIRHDLISPHNALTNYRMPTSAFIYTSGKDAKITLGNTPYHMQHYGVFHSGKGSHLSIEPTKDWLEYYIIFYRAGEPTFHKREFETLLKFTNPFCQQFGFTPQNPLFFAYELQKIYEHWKLSDSLNLFYSKSAFYQLVYQVYEEIHKGHIQVFEPDIIAIAQDYLDKHYREPISIQEMCRLLDISYSHFHRTFKQKNHKSPQEYLITARLNAAKDFLQNSNAKLHEISAYCGFPDESNFYRLFVKNVGMAPGVFREKSQLGMRDNAIATKTPFLYNEQSSVSLSKPKEEGAFPMFKLLKNKAVLASAMSLVLMLSACAPAANTNNSESTPSSSVSSQASEIASEAPDSSETRTISTIKGDVEVPANPQRVIATYGMGDVIALGITPVATYDAAGSAYAEKVASLPVWNEFESEEIMSYEPDLILVISDKEYDEASKIAPTVFVPFTELSMDERIAFLGEILNKEDEAKKLLADFNEKITSSKKQLEEKGILSKTFSIFESSSNGSIWVFGDKWGRGGDLVYSHLGLSAPKVIEDEIIAADQYRELSMEVVGDYAGDYIIFSGELGDLETNPVWNSIPAVEAGHIIPIDFTLFYDIDIYSSNVQLDYLMDALMKIG
ncbi:AraC family transcriptional regulator [Scatolibacter rhodanostii]|uniref:AraC family transcriptional regulator n=1 Tax=Scatolibacter rhodanostii TaxID=2014781 RepID=UPI000C07FC1F|nr:AraC family transcriptional regulator [Scatolibacter rhodanostii]